MSAARDQPSTRAARGGRREAIIVAALETIIERGVHGTSHRVVAECAGVPLGSMTYYFSGLTELLEEAFALLQRSIATEHRDILGAAQSQSEAITAIVELISGDRGPTPEQMRGLAEMYAFANHNARVAHLSRDWLDVTAVTLRRHFDPGTTSALDALVEGWNLHRAFAGAPPDRAVVERAVRGIVGGD